MMVERRDPVTTDYRSLPVWMKQMDPHVENTHSLFHSRKMENKNKEVNGERNGNHLFKT